MKPSATPDRHEPGAVNELVVERRGSGPAVLFIHGIGGRWQMFEPVLDRIAAAGYEVIALDLPGFGASRAQASLLPSPRGYAEWLTTWLASEAIARPHVVGNSMGGGIALELGRAGVASGVTALSPIGFYRRPGLHYLRGVVGALRLVSEFAGPVLDRVVEHPAGRAAVLGFVAGRPTKVTPAVAQADAAALAGAASFHQARDSFADYVLRKGDDLGGLGDIPVTIAWGKRDVVLPFSTQSRRAREVLPLARHIALTGCGHVPFNDDPTRCADIVLNAVQGEHSGRHDNPEGVLCTHSGGADQTPCHRVGGLLAH